MTQNLNRIKRSIVSAQTTKKGRATKVALVLLLLVTRGRWSDIYVRYYTCYLTDKTVNEHPETSDDFPHIND